MLPPCTRGVHSMLPPCTRGVHGMLPPCTRHCPCLQEVNGMLDIDQKCASLALACGRSSPPCPALRGPGAAEQGSSALKESIRELFVPCEGLQLSEEQMTQLAIHFQTVRGVYMAGHRA